MVTEDKKLLLKDLNARLSYGVKFQFHQVDIVRDETLNEICLPLNVVNTCYPIDKIKPYLRPMSSMTEEEEIRFQGFKIKAVNSINIPNSIKMIDWLNENHFDFRGLIPMGLALEAPEDMYEKGGNNESNKNTSTER